MAVLSWFTEEFQNQPKKVYYLLLYVLGSTERAESPHLREKAFALPYFPNSPESGNRRISPGITEVRPWLPPRRRRSSLLVGYPFFTYPTRCLGVHSQALSSGLRFLRLENSWILLAWWRGSRIAINDRLYIFTSLPTLLLDLMLPMPLIFHKRLLIMAKKTMEAVWKERANALVILLELFKFDSCTLTDVSGCSL